MGKERNRFVKEIGLNNSVKATSRGCHRTLALLAIYEAHGKRRSELQRKYKFAQ